MSQQPSGWYDDPSDPDMLRYWDGVTWTNHTAPRKSPTAGQSTIGLPQAQPPVAPAPPPAYQGGGQQAPNPYGYQGGQYPQAPANAQWMTAVKTTADGVPLASWGRRLGARLLDNLVLLVAILVLGWTWISKMVDVYVSFVEEASRTGVVPDTLELQEQIAPNLVPLAILGAVIGVLYETVFLMLRGATPGKMALGISVRRTSHPGPLSLVDALRRQLIQLANSLLSLLPAISLVLNILVLLDYLWPLWDDKRQALHDKLADTQVVLGPQPRTG